MNTDNARSKIILSSDSTISDAAEYWFRNIYHHDRYQADVRSIIIYEIIPRLGTLHINEIQHDHVVIFCHDVLCSGVTFSSAQFAITQLASIYTYLMDTGLVKSNPWYHPFINRPRRINDTCSESDIINILRLSQDDIYRLPLYMVMFMDINPEECLALCWDDFDTVHNELHISKRIDVNNVTADYPIRAVNYYELRKIYLPEVFVTGLLNEKRYQLHNMKYNPNYKQSDFNPIFTLRDGHLLSVCTLFSKFRSYAFMINKPDLHLGYFKGSEVPDKMSADIVDTLIEIFQFPPYKYIIGRPYSQHKGELR